MKVKKESKTKKIDNNNTDNNNNIDFTDWGFGVVYWGVLFSLAFNELCGNEDPLNQHGILAWGKTAMEAWKKHNKILEKIFVKQVPKIYSCLYRITPRAIKYLDIFGLDRSVNFVNIPFTVDNFGYPVTYIIDLTEENAIKKLEEYGLENQEINNPLKQLSESVSSHKQKLWTLKVVSY